jgi:hypothetical protein
MCLPENCAGGLGRGTTYFDDILTNQAPHGGQMLAENAIMAMTTEAFWEQAARENGVTDMVTVAAAWKKVVSDLNDEFLKADFQMGASSGAPSGFIMNPQV